MAFINKMDILGANFYGAVEQIRTRLGKNAICLQLPIGKEDEFKGIVDLFEMQAYIYNDDKGDDVTVCEIPDDMTVCLENVLEPEAALLTQIVRGVDDPRLRICLDLGHANTFASKEPPEAWLRACAPFLSHVHLHNNEGGRDLHAALMDGKMDCAALLRLLAQLAPEATCTLELMQDRPSLRWLEEQELLE